MKRPEYIVVDARANDSLIIADTGELPGPGYLFMCRSLRAGTLHRRRISCEGSLLLHSYISTSKE